MKQISFFISLMLIMSLLNLNCSNTNSSNTEEKIEALVKQMTLQEKVDLLSGIGMSSRSIDRLGIPALKMTDGPIGVNFDTATAFPCGVALAASWDTALLRQVGKIIAIETKACGRNYLLGPCVNINRLPISGRNFESYGEDPYLAGRLAIPYIQGIQGEKVLASVKHLACNNQEWERFRSNSVVGERALREIYLPAFKAAVQEGKAWTVMSAYNKVNGYYCSENAHLLIDILKNEWKFDGFVISDWTSVYSTVDAANAGLDMEMPKGKFFGDSLVKAVNQNDVEIAVIDEKVRRHLRARFRAGLFEENQEIVSKDVLHSKAHKDLALESAQKGIVLLKNQNSILPLSTDKIKSIAVIGPNAAKARTGGGGSSEVTPFGKTSPLEAIKAAYGDKLEINYHQGVLLQGEISMSEDISLSTDNKKGLVGTYFNNMKFEGEPSLTRLDDVIDFSWGGGESPDPSINDDGFSVRWTGKIISSQTGNYRLDIYSNDAARIFINNERVINDWTGLSRAIYSAEIKMQKDVALDIRIEYYEEDNASGVKLGCVRLPDLAQSLKEAAQMAKESDVAIIFAGLTKNYEHEADDKTNGLKMPGYQDELIKAVVAANPNTIVVLTNGIPILMNEWINDVPAIVESFYLGQEVGYAISDVLFGEINPAGKMPFSLYKQESDCPAFKGYMDESLEVNYTEGIYVGYRYLEKNEISPNFPFGHGLSYTTFGYENISVEKTGEAEFTVKLDITNTGKVEGAEVAQVYVRDIESSIDRPIKELKGFSKVNLKSGETKTISIKLKKDAFSFYSVEKKQWVAEPGEFEIQVGSSSQDIRVKETIIL